MVFAATPLLIAVLALTLSAEASQDWSQLATEVSGVDGHRAGWGASARRLGALCGALPSPATGPRPSV